MVERKLAPHVVGLVVAAICTCCVQAQITVWLVQPSPSEGEFVCGVVELCANVEIGDGAEIDRVEYYANGALLPGGVLREAPFLYTWDTTTAVGMNQTVRVEAYDIEGNMAVDSRTFVLWCGAEKSRMPTERYHFTVDAVGGKLYAIGGYEDAYFVVEAYDPRTDTWTTKASPNKGRAGHASCVVDGRIYVFGGDEGRNWIADVEVYDPVSDTWSIRSQIPGEGGCPHGIGLLACCSVGGKVYLMGGLGPEQNTVREYDPTSDTWSFRASMNVGRYMAASCVVNGKIYVIGGCLNRERPPNDTPLASVEEYDPLTDAWLLKASMPTRRYAMACCALGGRIYVFGGDGTDEAPVEVYDPATDTWSTLRSMPSGMNRFGCGVIEGLVYLVGGDRVYEYLP